jgi:SAM-dependent methyltransferase
MTGDFGKVAVYLAEDAKEFVDRLHIQPRTKVLDVACGTGNLSIPAAHAGADIVGSDIAPNLLVQARTRAAAEGVNVLFEEGDAEQLPYADRRFDLVMSMFGTMFALRPELVASELTRVCRSGGIIAIANWTREGFVGKMFAVNSHHAAPPPGMPSPLLWGDESTVRWRLRFDVARIDFARRSVSLAYPFPPKLVVAFFREFFGPTKMTFARLETKAQIALAADLEMLWTDHNEADSQHTRVTADYLEVIAVRA